MIPSEEARKYLGEKEILGNQGFVNPALEIEMKEEGWQTGYAWCMILAKVVYVNCFPERSIELRKLFVPGVLNTFRNFKEAGYKDSKNPEVDSLVVWAQMRGGKQTGFGHAGIVTEVTVDGFKSIEGNTSSAQVREGYIVAEHFHKLNYNAFTGLRLMGFINVSKPQIKKP